MRPILRQEFDESLRDRPLNLWKRYSVMRVNYVYCNMMNGSYLVSFGSSSRFFLFYWSLLLGEYLLTYSCGISNERTA
jgi:hypothetical protein